MAFYISAGPIQEGLLLTVLQRGSSDLFSVWQLATGTSFETITERGAPLMSNFTLKSF